MDCGRCIHDRENKKLSTSGLPKIDGAHRQWIPYAVLLVAVATLTATTVDMGCPPGFDCHSYIAMTHSLVPDQAVPPHHAMRVLPSFLVMLLAQLGVSVHQGFKMLSLAGFAGFAFGFYYYLRKEELDAQSSLGFTLLVLHLHPMLLFPLRIVYQASDMLTYPLTLGILYCTFHRRSGVLFGLTVLGVLTRQNLLLLGGFCLAFHLFQKRTLRVAAMCIAVLAEHLVLAEIYQAHGVLLAHLKPGSHLFRLGSFFTTLIESQLGLLLMPLVPFLVAYRKELLGFLRTYWFIPLYSAIVVYQPFAHYSGAGEENFVRIALQGIWPLLLAAALVFQGLRVDRRLKTGLLAFGVGFCLFPWWWVRLLLAILFAAACLRLRKESISPGDSDA